MNSVCTSARARSASIWSAMIREWTASVMAMNRTSRWSTTKGSPTARKASTRGAGAAGIRSPSSSTSPATFALISDAARARRPGSSEGQPAPVDSTSTSPLTSRALSVVSEMWTHRTGRSRASSPLRISGSERATSSNRRTSRTVGRTLACDGLGRSVLLAGIP